VSGVAVDLLIAIITLALLAVVIIVISAPLRAVRRPPSGDEPAEDRAELEAAREAKYREIRDTELDYRTGKLSREDYETVNGALRADAVEILDRLEVWEREAEEKQAMPPPK
jgi:hypothetical protein